MTQIYIVNNNTEEQDLNSFSPNYKYRLYYNFLTTTKLIVIRNNKEYNNNNKKNTTTQQQNNHVCSPPLAVPFDL